MPEPQVVAAGAVMVLVAATGFEPLRALQRGVIRARALWLVVPLAARAAWREAERMWPECVRAARSDA